MMYLPSDCEFMQALTPDAVYAVRNTITYTLFRKETRTPVKEGPE